jgi:predicted lipoprotein with Yx(FWY)xxD motif
MKFRAAGISVLAVVAVVVAGCGSSSSSSSSTAAAAPAPTSSSSSATSTSAAASGLTIGTAQAHGTTYLTGAGGRALYLWAADKGGKSSCSGTCATVWSPVTGKATASAGVIAGDLGTIARSDGSQQVTYKGHPLYYYAADKSSGQTSGQGTNSFGAKWWLVAPSGSAITSGASSASSGGGAYGGGSSSSSSWG